MKKILAIFLIIVCFINCIQLTHKEVIVQDEHGQISKMFVSKNTPDTFTLIVCCQGTQFEQRYVIQK